MQIDNILRQKEFQELDQYLDEEMLEKAGDKLLTQIQEFFDSEDRARDWFYSPVKAFNEQRPYDLCKEGRGEEIELLLYRLECGIIV